jgi:hypothetical protein
VPVCNACNSEEANYRYQYSIFELFSQEAAMSHYRFPFIEIFFFLAGMLRLELVREWPELDMVPRLLH